MDARRWRPPEEFAKAPNELQRDPARALPTSSLRQMRRPAGIRPWLGDRDCRTRKQSGLPSGETRLAAVERLVRHTEGNRAHRIESCDVVRGQRDLQRSEGPVQLLASA